MVLSRQVRYVPIQEGGTHLQLGKSGYLYNQAKEILQSTHKQEWLAAELVVKLENPARRKQKMARSKKGCQCGLV
jgi:hypothetical protein